MVDMEGSLPESPWDSLDKIEASLVSETKLDNLFSEFNSDGTFLKID